jgi:hypothetical protein
MKNKILLHGKYKTKKIKIIIIKRVVLPTGEQ